MVKTKKILSFAVALSLAVVSLTGCGASDDSSQENAKKIEVEDTTISSISAEIITSSSTATNNNTFATEPTTMKSSQATPTGLKITVDEFVEDFDYYVAQVYPSYNIKLKYDSTSTKEDDNTINTKYTFISDSYILTINSDINGYIQSIQTYSAVTVSTIMSMSNSATALSNLMFLALSPYFALQKSSSINSLSTFIQGMDVEIDSIVKYTGKDSKASYLFMLADFGTSVTITPA